MALLCSPNLTTTMDEDLKNDNSITTKELSECDREALHQIAYIQGGAGHLLFISYPEGKILSHDEHIRQLVWFRDEDDNINEGEGAPAQEGIAERIETLNLSYINGSFLDTWIPRDLYKTLMGLIEKMKNDLSQRAFHFHSHNSTSYAISISTTLPDASIIGIEIEKLDASDVCYLLS